MKQRGKRQKCVDCGFLGLFFDTTEGNFYREITPDIRMDDGFKGYPLDCNLQCWKEEEKSGFEVMWKTARTSRYCPYFLRYRPGYDPDEHKQIKRDIENRRAMRNATLMGAGIGAAAAIVAQVLYRVIVNS